MHTLLAIDLALATLVIEYPPIKLEKNLCVHAVKMVILREMQHMKYITLGQ